MAKQKFDIKNLSLGTKKAEDVEKVVKEIAEATKPAAKAKPAEKPAAEEPKPATEKRSAGRPKKQTTEPRKKREPKKYAHSLLSEDTRRFTLDIPKKMYLKIKIKAAEQEMTMKELILEAVEEMYGR